MQNTEAFRNAEAPHKEQYERDFQDSMKKLRANMEEIYERAQREARSPLDVFFEEAKLYEAKEVYGDEKIKRLQEDMKNFTFSSKEEFIEKALEAIGPLARERFFNPAVREKIEEILRENQPENLVTGKLESNIHSSNFDFEISDGTQVARGDKVLEIQWPEKGEAPRGTRDIKEAFKEIARALKEREDIKAVVGVSWIMSRKITDRLGFEKFPNIDITQEQRQSILGLAWNARKDKEYQKGVSEKDVLFGAVSREQFLEKYE